MIHQSAVRRRIARRKIHDAREMLNDERSPHRLRRPRARAGLEAAGPVPSSTSSIVHPATAELRTWRRASHLAVADHAAVMRFCKDNDIGLVVIGPEAPLVAGLVDDLATTGIKCFGPQRAAARLEASKGYTKDLAREYGIPTAAYETVHRGVSREGLSRRQEPSHRGQGRRARRRQGRHDLRHARRSRQGDRGVLCRRFRRGGRRNRGGRVSRRRGSKLFRARRRSDGASADRRAGPQAGGRRRHRPQHRRHGRLLAGTGDDACDHQEHDGQYHHADGGCHGRARHAVPGRAVCRPDDHGAKDRSSSSTMCASATPRRRC